MRRRMQRLSSLRSVPMRETVAEDSAECNGSCAVPSPETLARNTIELDVVCLRNERQRCGDCKRNRRMFLHRPNALPLLGERVGVRGNEANSNPRRTMFPGTLDFASPAEERGVSGTLKITGLSANLGDSFALTKSAAATLWKQLFQ